MIKPKVMYVDGFNLFYQSFATNKAMNDDGEPIGGYIGFISQLQKIVAKFTPSKTIVVFDGPDAGYRRRKLFPDYKGKRGRKNRLACVDFGDGDKVYIDNEQEQLKLVWEFLKQLPVEVLIIPFFEADDVIAYLASKNKDTYNIIVTNDRDYIQLVNENTAVYATQKKLLFTLEVVRQVYDIEPKNFIYMRTIVGDSSDKLNGVLGIGRKKLDEHFPQIKVEAFDSFEDFWNAIEALNEGDKKKKSKTLLKLKEGRERSHLMYRLMLLDHTSLNLKAIELVKAQMEEQKTKTFSKTSLKLYCIKNKLEQHIKEFDAWIRPFSFFKQDLKIEA